LYLFIGNHWRGGVGDCARLSQPSWLLGTLQYSYTYLLTSILISYTFHEEVYGNNKLPVTS